MSTTLSNELAISGRTIGLIVLSTLLTNSWSSDQSVINLSTCTTLKSILSKSLITSRVLAPSLLLTETLVSTFVDFSDDCLIVCCVILDLVNRASIFYLVTTKTSSTASVNFGLLIAKSLPYNISKRQAFGYLFMPTLISPFITLD